ncbi:MAG: winged helix-turn-helix domain-containing protein [Alphaproteobacteria bacterium]
MTAIKWVISGTSKNVGKSFLAQKLCAILPDSRYAKLGHGTEKKGKPTPYFQDRDAFDVFVSEHENICQHLVIESPQLAKDGGGDVIICLAPCLDEVEIRADVAVLLEQADIVLQAGADAPDIKKILQGKKVESLLSETVAALFIAQHAYLNSLSSCDKVVKKKGQGKAPAVRTKLWFSLPDGHHVFGAGLARLLEGIAETETLRGAAEKSEMSYRYAWGLIQSAEKNLGQKLVLKEAGGKGGGRSFLSDEGQKLSQAFRLLQQDIADYADQKFAEYYPESGGQK